MDNDCVHWLNNYCQLGLTDVPLSCPNKPSDCPYYEPRYKEEKRQPDIKLSSEDMDYTEHETYRFD